MPSSHRGAGWGDKGYVQIARGTTGPGVCGIALQNVYARCLPPQPPPPAARARAAST
jgi:hypothetical protein